MKTEALIARLAENSAAPEQPQTIFAKGVMTGGFVALALTMAVLGPRHDMLTAVSSWQYWAKFVYPLTLAIAGFLVLERLARPGAAPGWRGWTIALPLVLIALLAANQWMTAPESVHLHLFYGHSWRLCPFLIVLVSAPVFAGTVWALRKLAPTRPVLAGAAAGLFAGAAGAWIYAFSCNESALVFISVWYTAGIAAMAALGAATGRWLLRW